MIDFPHTIECNCHLCAFYIQPERNYSGPRPLEQTITIPTPFMIPKKEESMTEIKFGSVLYDPLRPDVIFVYDGQKFVEIKASKEAQDENNLPGVRQTGKRKPV